MNCLRGVVAGTRGAVADTASELVEGMPLADAAPFEYTLDALSSDIEELAATTSSPNFSVKMLGYDHSTFGCAIHSMKDDLNLGADNVIWHDNGDVEFKKKIIGNMHDYK